MRKHSRKISLLFLFILFIISANFKWANAQIGYWAEDDAGLPLFHYTGKYPFSANTPQGKKINTQNDPFSILGNYRLTVFAHASGKYQFITGERVWARMNSGDSVAKGEAESGAFITINGKLTKLTGQNSISENEKKTHRIWGTGFVEYNYQTVENVKVTRIFSVKPSQNYNDGIAAMRITLKIKNVSKTPAAVAFTEWIRANYETQYQIVRSPKKVDYSNLISQSSTYEIIKADVIANQREPMLYRTKNDISEFDGFPPSLFLKVVSPEGVKLFASKDNGYDNLNATAEFLLKPNEEKTVELVVGISQKQEFQTMNEMSKALMAEATLVKNEKNISTIPFRNEWKNRLPSFSQEKNDALKRELIWDAYVLHCMATYSDFFKETKIPLGACYDYIWGMHVCTRDHAQLALAPMYYDQDLAKSILRYVFKRMNKKGELHMAEHGYGFVSHGTLFGSDNQLYPLWAMSEWLRITKDNSFLLETTEYYPMNSGAKGNMIQKIEEAFLYMRDEVRIGKHGLMRNLNSDWSDDVHFVSANAPFNRNFMNSESNTNSAMAIVVLKTLADELEKASINTLFSNEKERLQNLVSAIRYFRSGLLQAVNKELEGRKFLTAYHFFDSDWGADKIFLLPNAFALQIPELALAKKIELYNELNIRVSKPEKLGARNREEPQTDGLHYAQPGTGENGGIWWCPNAQYILGVNTFDKKRANELFNKTLFTYHAKTFPKYWVGQWTASDFLHSSISDSEGATNNYPFCALPHAFKLYLYHKLKE